MTASALVLQAALKGAVIFGIAAMATYVLRNREAALRHQIWTGAIIAQLCLLALVPSMPRISVPLFPHVSWSFDRAETVSGDVTPAASALTSADVSKASNTVAVDGGAASDHVVTMPASREALAKRETRAAPARSRLTARTIVASIWLAGTAMILLRFMYGTFVMARLARQGERVEDGSWLTLTQRTAKKLGILRPLTLLRGDALTVPVTWGVIYPIVLLPADAVQWSEERRRFVLVHEMAHVKRFDALTQLVAQIAVAVFWFSPFVWIAEQRMRVEREHACDDVVLDEGTRAVTYADELLQMVRAMGTRQRAASAPAFAALAMARRSEFEGRMLAILDPSRPRSTNVRGIALAAFALVLIAGPLAALSPFAASARPATPNAPAAPNALKSPNAPESPTSPTSPTSARTSGAGVTPPSASTGNNTSLPSPAGNCEGENLRPGRTSTHVSVDDDPSDFRASYLNATTRRCIQADLLGVVKVSADETQVTSMSDNASLFLREVTSSSDRSVRITPASNGGIEYRYALNDQRVAFDEAGRAWAARMLPEFMRETGINAKERMSRAAAGGIAEATSLIRRIQSASARRQHLLALAQLHAWKPAQIDSIAEAAGTLLKDSPRDLAQVLREITRQNPPAARSGTIETALRSIQSSGELSNALAQMLPGADKETLLMIADVARSINSDGDKASLLVTAAPFFLPRRDDALRTAFFKTYDTINSAGDRAVVLNAAIKFGHGNEPLVRSIIRGSHNIQSSGSRAVVLTAVAKEGLVTSKSLRDAFAAEAASPDLSDGDRAVVLAALLHNEN